MLRHIGKKHSNILKSSQVQLKVLPRVICISLLFRGRRNSTCKCSEQSIKTWKRLKIFTFLNKPVGTVLIVFFFLAKPLYTRAQFHQMQMIPAGVERERLRDEQTALLLQETCSACREAGSGTLSTFNNGRCKPCGTPCLNEKIFSRVNGIVPSCSVQVLSRLQKLLCHFLRKTSLIHSLCYVKLQVEELCENAS